MQAKLESDLAATQAALIQEQQENAALRAALQSCQAEKDNLESQNRRLSAVSYLLRLFMLSIDH